MYISIIFEPFNPGDMTKMAAMPIYGKNPSKIFILMGGKTVYMSFEGKLANGQNIDYSENKWPKGFICPCTGAKYHNIQTCLLVYVADLR